MKVANLKSDESLHVQVVSALEQVGAGLRNENKQMLSKVLVKGAVKYIIPETQENVVLVLIYPKHMDMLRQAMVGDKSMQQLENKLAGRRIFFISQVRSITEHQRKFMARKCSYKYTKTNVDRVFVRDALFPAIVGGHRKSFCPGKNGEKDIYLINPKLTDFMYPRIKAVTSLVNSFTGQNCEIMFGKA